MKKTLRILALIVALGAVITWVATGAHVGWTTTSQAVKVSDPVTGLDGVEYHARFQAGVDFLGVAAAMAAGLAGVSFLFRSKKPANTTNTTNATNN
jgi:hypothetical protein